MLTNALTDKINFDSGLPQKSENFTACKPNWFPVLPDYPLKSACSSAYTG
jgi:hypothetical protein